MRLLLLLMKLLPQHINVFFRLILGGPDSLFTILRYCSQIFHLVVLFYQNGD